jgi:hypothetical protein
MDVGSGTAVHEVTFPPVNDKVNVPVSVPGVLLANSAIEYFEELLIVAESNMTM